MITGRPAFEVQARSSRPRLHDAGIVRSDGDEHAEVFEVQPDLRRPLIGLLEELPVAAGRRKASSHARGAWQAGPGRAPAEAAPAVEGDRQRAC